jgi:hypothetical protein
MKIDSEKVKARMRLLSEKDKDNGCFCGDVLDVAVVLIEELERENKQLHTLLGPNKPFFKET